MSLQEKLNTRSTGVCELCSSKEGLTPFEVAPSDASIDQTILICNHCNTQLSDMSNLDETHWHCLNDSMWSEVDAVKVVAYRVLKSMKNQELLDMIYLEDDMIAWAEEGLFESENKSIHRDSNGVILTAGDTVNIIKDLEVKGAGFTAKRGTAVRNISLPRDDESHIEGRVNGVKIMILTQYIKK